MTVKERIKIFVDSKKMTVSAFEKSIDASNGYVNSISKSIGIDKLVLILEHYPNLNIEWLLTGKGEMLKEDGTEIVKKSQYPIHDNVRKVEEPPIAMKRDAEFEEMQRELIRSQKDQISCYKELISELKKEHTDYVPGLDVSRQELKK